MIEPFTAKEARETTDTVGIAKSYYVVHALTRIRDCAAKGLAQCVADSRLSDRQAEYLRELGYSVQYNNGHVTIRW